MSVRHLDRGQFLRDLEVLLVLDLDANSSAFGIFLSIINDCKDRVSQRDIVAALTASLPARNQPRRAPCTASYTGWYVSSVSVGATTPNSCQSRSTSLPEGILGGDMSYQTIPMSTGSTQCFLEIPARGCFDLSSNALSAMSSYSASLTPLHCWSSATEGYSEVPESV
jgi:hypothetical protein